MCLPCVAATGFTGLSFLEGPLKDCTKFQKPNKQNRLPARVCSTRLFVLRRRPCSPEGGVKTPAVKPCIIDMTVSTLQRWFKSASSLTACTCCQPLYIVFAADLIKYIFEQGAFKSTIDMYMLHEYTPMYTPR